MLKTSIAIALVFAAAAPASAVTFILGGPNGNVASVARSAEGIDLTVTARKFSAAPGSLTNLSQLGAARLVSVSAPGLGVAGGASGPQVDTNQPTAREALIVTASNRLRLTNLKLSYVDSDDTLQVYGIRADNSLVSLGFGGTIAGGLGGMAGVVNSGANSGTSVLSLLNETLAYSGFLFTTRVGGDVMFGGGLGQGYRLDSIGASGVPEPRTWALLVAGFGLVGVTARRRRAAQA